MGLDLKGMTPMLKRWHETDPPNAHERLRNNVIQKLQGNRNRFIDLQYRGVGARQSHVGVEPFEIPDQKQPEIAAWQKTRPPHLLGVKRRAQLLHVRIEPGLIQNPRCRISCGC
jgi:hypothetical protein